MNSRRALVLWFPDWPVRAAGAGDDPAAVMHAGVVVACNAAARAQGVRRGQRRRLAQTRAPSLRVLSADPHRDERVFLPVLRMLEAESPGTLMLRAGLVALRARGAARYYGGEAAACAHLRAVLAEHGHPDVRAGVADGLFTAELAARQAAPTLVVPVGAASEFLAPLPVDVLDDDEITGLLQRLGVRTLADFAALGEDDVRARFGQRGVRLHSLSAGADSRPVDPRPPTADPAREVSFDEPLEQADQIGFAVRRTADDLVGSLALDSQVCTEVRIDLTDDRGAMSSRVWAHPSSFEATDLIDRVRWQLEGLEAGDATAGIVTVRITPTMIDDVSHHQPGLFGQGPQQRLHHTVSRVQALLGHRGVVTPQVSGGRRLGDRQAFLPWGDRTALPRDPERPWPGSLPAPHPSEVFAEPMPMPVLAEDGTAPVIDDRGLLSAPPATLDGVPVLAWAGPWPLRERGWEGGPVGQRMQIVDERQRAWLMLWERGTWWAEGRYR